MDKRAMRQSVTGCPRLPGGRVAEQESQDLVLPQQEAGLSFRIEMLLSDLFFRYWKGLVVTIAAALIGAYAYGTWTTHVDTKQRLGAADVFDLVTELDAIPAMGDLTDTQRQQLIDIGARLDAVGQATGGTGDALARLNAAAAYDRAGDHEAQARTLQTALRSAGGDLRGSVLSALANAELSAGQADAAILHWSELVKTGEGIIAQQAAVDLGVVLESLNRSSDALIVYTAFKARWPDSVLGSQVDAHLASLNTAAAEPTPDGAPQGATP